MTIALVVVLAAVAVALTSALGGGKGAPGDAVSSRRSAQPHGARSGSSTRTSTLPTGGFPLDAAKFANGACVAFAPIGRANHHSVFLDAGHGGIDPGGQGVTETGKVIYEAPENLAIELQTMALLRDKGFRVVVSRITSTLVVRTTTADRTSGVLSAAGAKADVAARDQCANLARATVLVGIYMDAGTSSLNAGSLTAYDPSRRFSADSLRLATVLQNDVLSDLNSHGWQIPDDGVQSDATLGGVPLTTTAAAYPHLLLLGPADPGWFTTPSNMPAALIEPLYVSDPLEGSIASSSTGHLAIARGITEAVEQYFAAG